MVKDGIVCVEIMDNNGKIIFRHVAVDSLPEVFQRRREENFSQNGFRNAFRKCEDGSVRVVLDDKHELFQGSKSIQRACLIYLNLIPRLKQNESSQRQVFEAIMRRFAHNLSKFQSRFKDNFIRLVPDGYRGRPFEELKDKVKMLIENDIDAAAYSVCQMSHRATDLDAQIETLRIISGFTDNSGSVLPANLAKALYRLTNPFIDELRKRGVKLIINVKSDVTEQEKVWVVHELFSAAMWQLFDNASKYALKDTDVLITAVLDSEPKKLMIDMISITIEESEEESIFLENYRGKNVVATDGAGIGMYIARKALKFMKASISVKNNGHLCDVGGTSYSKHTFTIQFNR